MNILKIILIAIALVFAAFGAMMLIGMAFTLLRAVFWLTVICVVVWLLWKMFGSKGDALIARGDDYNELQNTEMTLDEYKRKIEEQLKQESERRS
jgi:membrane protein implicated in regulation of membrane protease activity